MRFGHWTLATAFAVAFFSAEEGAGGPGVWHVWTGYLVGGIVVLRVLWGLSDRAMPASATLSMSPVKSSPI